MMVRLRDYARLGQLMLEDGAGLLAPGWVTDATRIHQPFAQAGRGYGYFWWDGRTRKAHRVAYSVIIGEPIPQGCELDHLCRRPSCVNPGHLEPITSGLNNRRSRDGFQMGKCRSGEHDVSVPGAVYVRPNGVRECRECKREDLRRWRAEGDR